jgi:hypothetical protein
MTRSARTFEYGAEASTSKKSQIEAQKSSSSATDQSQSAS